MSVMKEPNQTESPPGYAQALSPLDPSLSAELRGFSVTEYKAISQRVSEAVDRSDLACRSPGAEPAAPPEPTAAEEAAAQQLVQQRNERCRTCVTQDRRVCIAVGDDCCSGKTLKYAAKYICKPQDSITVVHISCNGSSAGSKGGGGSGGALSCRAVGSHGGGQQRAPGGGQAGGGGMNGGHARSKGDGGGAVTPEELLLVRARDTLLRTGKVQPEQVCLAVLPAGKQVGRSLVAHCQECQYDILVMGSRGVSGMKSRLLSLVGSEGSVSKYCRDHLPRVAVVVVRPPSGHDWGKS